MLYNDMKFTPESGLLASGLEWNDLAELLAKKMPETELLKQLEKKGGKYAKRYGLWKQYRTGVQKGEIKEAIIPVIGAMPCVGKTTLARELSTRLGIGIVMGGDAFRAALREFVDKEKNPAFFTSVYDSYKFFGEKTHENIIKGFDAQAKLLNQAMERIVADRGIRDGESIIAEFLHFLPSQWDPEVIQYPAIIPLVLRLNSEAEHKKRIQIRETTTHLKGKSQRLLEILDIYRLLQEHQAENARQNNVPVIDADNLEKAVDRALEIIFERVARLIELKEAPSIEKVEQLKKEREEAKKKAEGKQR